MPKNTIFSQFVNQMSEAQVEAYAARCLTTPRYIVVHLKHGSKVPRGELMVRLVQESGGKVARDDVLNHFYPRELFEVKDN